MRKWITILMVALFAAPIAADTTVMGGLIQMMLLKYEPSPAEPGAYADIWLSVSNIRSSLTAKNIYCEVADTYPFTVDDETNRRKEMGSLQSGYDTTIKWKVLVDENAVPGNNVLEITCQHDGYPALTLEADIYVQPTEAILAISGTEVPVMAPGEQKEVKVHLRNMAPVSVKEVSVKLDLEGLSFAPIGSTSEKHVSLIKGNGEETVSFTLIAYPNAQPGVYKIPVTLTYYDRLGTAYEKEDVLGVIIDAETELDVNLESTELFKAGSSGEVSFEVVNRGLEDVKFLTVKALPSESYAVTSVDKAYLGELSSDDSGSAEYKIYAKPGQESLPVLLELSYTDSFNQQKTETVTVEIPLYTDEELAVLGIVPITETNLLMVAIGLLIAGYAAYRIHKRFAKKK